MKRPNVVLDTNVLVAALRSQRGASFRLLSLVGSGKFDLTLSVPLVIEYEDMLVRQCRRSPITRQDVGNLLDYLCSIAKKQDIFFLWRPVLRDPKDDMILELAVAARCSHIVTFNQRDFAEANNFTIDIINPKAFLEKIGALR
jgi:putative PIN family toxin of toxin-antitoxin system